MELSFDDAVISTGNTNNYLEVGNHKVKVTKVEKGLSSKAQSPYVEITVADERGYTCSQQYYLNTKVSEGKKQSAWNISSAAILTLVAAANNTDEAGAKSKLAGMTGENIDAKLASLLVGKAFGITLNGKWINPEDTAKNSWVKAEFGSYLFAVPADKMDKLSKKPYIKGEDFSATRSASQDSPSGAIVAAATAW